jgi:peptidoglycan/LPS O-acetylase OafA/YrhL
MVIASHAMPFMFNSIGREGVWLFFVISGFLITLPFFRRLAAGKDWYPQNYALRRAAKIVPPYALSVLLFTLLLAVDTHSAAPFRGGLETLFFFQMFREPDPVILVIYWSLAAEVFFYLATPLLFFAGRRVIQRWPWFVPAAFLAIFGFTGIFLWPDANLRENQPFVRDVLSSFVFFGWGALFACAKACLPAAWMPRPGWAVVAGALGFAGCVLATLAVHFGFIRGVADLTWSPVFRVIFGAAAFLLLFVVEAAAGWPARVLSLPLLALGGVVSYEWYLFHLFFAGLARDFPEFALHSWPLLLLKSFLGFPVAFVFSAILYRIYSLPILRWAHALPCQTGS